MVVSKVKKKLGVHCCAYACRNKPGKSKGGLCDKHYSRKRKELDPVYDRYFNFKGNALRRNKEFTITLEEFRQFCADTGYILRSGFRGKNATIDRVDNRFGYHVWNIQILSMRKNIRKYYDHDRKVVTETYFKDECDNIPEPWSDYNDIDQIPF